MDIHILKSFVNDGVGGNGAGVVILDKEISDNEMKNIAADVGLSETAFVIKKDKNNYDVRFFTPVNEVDLCGHATIAAFYYIGEYINSSKNNITLYQNTKAGRFRVDIFYKDNHVENVMMEQAKPTIYGEVSAQLKKGIADSLNIDISNIGLVDTDISANIVSTGVRDIIIPVKNRALLNSVVPNLNKIYQISMENDVLGYHVFTIEDGQVYARNFAPLCGINEECATGTSNGALGALLYSYDIKKGYFEVLQGEAMGMTSKICVDICDNHIFVGGTVVNEKYCINKSIIEI